MKQKRYSLYFIFAGVLIGALLSFLFMQDRMVKSREQYQQLHITRQAEWMDSIRRSSQSDLISNIVDKIEDELRNHPERKLSAETIDRLADVSYAFKPYRYPEGDSVRTKKLSPERGLLLMLLSAMKIDSGTLDMIMFKADFTDADLREADLRGANLMGANLSGADLQDANLQGANMHNSNVSLANLWGSNLSDANLNGVNFKRADLRWADLDGADLKNANLNGADLTSAQMRKINLQGGSMIWAVATGALLNEANMDSIQLVGTNFHKANLHSAILAGANMTRANLTDANLTKVDFTGTDLNLIRVSESNWLTLLNEWNVTGAKEVRDKYKIAADRSKGKHQYHLEKAEELKPKTNH